MVKTSFESALELLSVLSDPLKYQALIADLQKERASLEQVRNDVIKVGTAQEYFTTSEKMVAEAEVLLKNANSEAEKIKVNAKESSDKLLAELNEKVAEKSKEIADAKQISKDLKEQIKSTRELEGKLSEEMKKYQQLNAELQASIDEYNEKKAKLLNALS